MAKITLKKGDKIFVAIPRFERSGSPPMRATVVVLSNTPGKQIGVEFEQSGLGTHNCDGYGPSDNCLWVRPKDIMTADQVKAMEKARKAAIEYAAGLVVDPVDSLDIEL